MSIVSFHVIVYYSLTTSFEFAFQTLKDSETLDYKTETHVVWTAHLASVVWTFSFSHQWLAGRQ